MRIGRTARVFTAEPLVSPVPATAREAAADPDAPVAPARPAPQPVREPATARSR